jgi:hypothetical protein
MANPLVAQPEGPSATAGAGLLSDIANLAGDHSPIDFSLDGVATGLDALSMTLDPFGSIASAGVGWLLNHVEFLREPIDNLAGDPAAIQAASQTWSNVANELEAAAQQYQSAVVGISGWTGSAADDYRAAASDYITLLQALSGDCGSTANGIEIAGVLVATERALIYDAISGFVGRCVVEAIAALAASWFTFGSSIAAFLALVDVDASIQAEKIALEIGNLTKQVGTVVKKLDGISQRFDELGTAISRAGGKLNMRAGGLKGRKTIGKNRFVRSNPDGAINTINRFETSQTHSTLGQVKKVAGSGAVKYPLTVAKQTEVARDQHDHPQPP